MFFPITLPEFWKKFRIVIEEVITEKLSPPIFPQTNVYVLRKRMLFRNDILISPQFYCKYFALSINKKSQKLLGQNVDDIFKEKILKLL